jgi:hypothetical protein
MRLLSICLVSSTSVLFEACSVFTPPIEKPVIQDYAGSIFSSREATVFSLTPERRTVVMYRGPYKDGQRGKPTFCAEPPPDVAQSLASSVRALAEAAAKTQTGQAANVSAEFSRSLTTSNTSLFYRSQGIQLFRDGLFNLCQSYMNGLIRDEKDFWERYESLMRTAFALTTQEIPTVQQVRNIDIANQVQDAKTSVAGALQKAQLSEAEAKKAADRAEEVLKQVKESLKKPQ